MKTLLVIGEHPGFVEAIRSGLNSEQYRVIERSNLEEAEPLLAHGLVQACIVDVELANVQGIWLLEKLRRRAAKCPIVLYTGDKKWEWEEEAYLQGAAHVLAKPVRPRMLTALLERLWPAATAPVPAAPAPLPAAGPKTVGESAANPVDVKLLAENVNFYYGKFQALYDVSIEFISNRVTALIGPSGCGKSTFLRNLNRINETLRDTKL